jgi:hypothetical protein
MQTLALLVGVRELGSVYAAKLRAQSEIPAHVDGGAYVRYYARFHFVLNTNPGCTFMAGGEAVHMAAGELWWFNHQVEHSVRNPGPSGFT